TPQPASPGNSSQGSWPASPDGREPAPVELTAVAPLGMPPPRQYALMGVLLIAPTLLIFFVVIAYPLVYAIYLSFFSIYTPTLSGPWVGLENYRVMLTSGEFWGGLATTIVWT